MGLLERTIKGFPFFSLKFPTTIEEVSTLVEILTAYKENHLPYVLGLFSYAYLFKQSFAIPGSVFMVSLFVYFTVQQGVVMISDNKMGISYHIAIALKRYFFCIAAH